MVSRLTFHLNALFTFSVLAFIMMMATSLFANKLFASELSASESSVSEDNQHFAALPAPTLSIALCNLQTYNQALSDINDKSKLEALDMVKVHELTYTLENAVMKLQEDLTIIAQALEKVHKASERLDAPVIKASGQTYLQMTTELLNHPYCSVQ